MTAANVIKTIDTPDLSTIPYGRWVAMVSELIQLGPGKSKQITPMLTLSQIGALRMAAKGYQCRVRVRTVGGSSVVSIKGR